MPRKALVFYICSITRNPRHPPLNAQATPPDETPDDRTVRHLRMCREMAELGLEIARHAAAAAAHEWATPASEPEPKPAPAERLPLPSAANPTATPRHEGRTSPSTAFARIINAIRQIIALETTIAATQATRQATTQKASRFHEIYAELNARAQTPAPVIPSTTPAAPTIPPAAPTGQNPVPSLLATISQELGVHLKDPATNPAPAARRQLEPTGPPA